MKGLEQTNADGDIFNIGSGVGTTVLTVANALKQNYQSDIEIKVSGNYRVGDIRHNIADLTKAKVKLGFEPKVSFSEGVEQFTAWVNNQAVEDDCYEDSISEMKEKGLYK